MEKVLQISMGETFGGIEKNELEWFRNIGNRISFDFLSPNDATFKDFKNEIEKLNGNVYNLNVSRKTKKGRIIYGHRLYKFLKNNNYKIIHINSGAFFFSLQVAIIAKMCKVKKIIVHSHNTYKLGKIKKLLVTILNPFYRSLVDEYITCSRKASMSLFTEKFINKNKVKLLNNGIDISKYKFDENVRNEYRKEYNLEEKTVYGNIARFDKVKNHLFLLDIFYEIQKQNKNSILMLVGDGECKKDVKERVRILNLEDKVIFTGFRDDANKFFNCIDIFIFPSKNEGLGLSLIEAQTNGLITYCSNTIPEEANISPNFKTFDLERSAYDIANVICKENIELNDRKDAYKGTIEHGYDIKKVADELDKIYSKLLKEVTNG